MAAVLLDFFGTLVTYSATRTQPGYDRTFALAGELGWTGDYVAWQALWTRTFDEMDELAEATGIEMSVHDVFATFAERAGFTKRSQVMADRSSAIGMSLS